MVNSRNILNKVLIIFLLIIVFFNTFSLATIPDEEMSFDDSGITYIAKSGYSFIKSYIESKNYSNEHSDFNYFAVVYTPSSGTYTCYFSKNKFIIQEYNNKQYFAGIRIGACTYDNSRDEFTIHTIDFFNGNNSYSKKFCIADENYSIYTNHNICLNSEDSSVVFPQTPLRIPVVMEETQLEMYQTAQEIPALLTPSITQLVAVGILILATLVLVYLVQSKIWRLTS